MSDCRALFTEESIINSIRKLLAGRVNEILAETEFSIPLIEFGGYEGGTSINPMIRLSTCERTEKERVIRVDAYALSITFTLPENPDSELHCYAYAAAVDRALAENPALGGIADRVVLTGKKYNRPKLLHCVEEGWEVVLTLRITVERAGK
ncbi:hypothetical protein AGMMS49546_35950 [Spirochaetia bacterium]|nr:hypothetical protein AGMMS49546_35950 [Spirochaetia bacterium]